MTALSVAVLLSAAMALVAGLVVRHRLAPLETLARRLGGLDPAQAMTPLDDEALPSEMRRLTVAFERALVRRDRSAARQQRFAADAAHQLRTPLGILQARLDTAGGAVACSELRGDIGRMARLIDQLLSLARNAGRPEARETVDLRRLCDAVIGAIVPLAIQSGKAVALQAPAEACWALCDPIAVGEALSNLVQNALDHTPVGGSVDVAVSPRLA